ncbi:MAG: hypothetical protein Q8L10_02325 [Candidatus Moranbacteria bacterium]|nr:hypothetical protein [Candidatus Moranbacteria bacterium]
MPKESLAVYFMTVACPWDSCESLQTVKLSRRARNYSAPEEYRCTSCGKSFRIAGVMNTVAK